MRSAAPLVRVDRSLIGAGRRGPPTKRLQGLTSGNIRAGLLIGLPGNGFQTYFLIFSL